MGIHKSKWPAMTIWYSLGKTRGYIAGPYIAGVPTFIGTSIYYGIKFMTFDAVTNSIFSISEQYDIAIHNDAVNAIGGLISGFIGNSVTYPNNAIRKTMQAAHICKAVGIPSG